MASSLDGFEVLSKRAQGIIGLAPEYFQIAYQAWQDPYDEKSNPDGFVDFGVAENRLSLTLVRDAMLRAPPIPSEYLTYGGMGGTLRFQEAVAALFTRFTRHVVDPNHLVLAAGASAILDVLITCVCDKGDKVLITSPVYRGFIADVTARSGGVIELAPLHDDSGFALTVCTLNDAWNAAGGEESGIRAVLLASPNNPTGQILSAETIQDVVEWVQERNLHLIMDEIYAFSVFSETASFVSVADVLRGSLGKNVHIVWSFSKDFCISGCRLGVLYTQNEALINVFAELSYLAGCSRHTQWAVMHMLEDGQWVDSYLKESRKRLASAYKQFTSVLQEYNIPYLDSEAGFFVCIDLRSWMADISEEAERELWMEMCAAKVLCIPATQMLSKSYGWFRCCFAASEEKVARVGLGRLGKMLKERGIQRPIGVNHNGSPARQEQN